MDAIREREDALFGKEKRDARDVIDVNNRRGSVESGSARASRE